MRRHKHKPGDLLVKKQGKRRVFAYQIPPTTDTQAPAGATLAVRMLPITEEKVLMLTQQAEPKALRRMEIQPAVSPLDALLILVEEITAVLQEQYEKPGVRSVLPFPRDEAIELACFLARTYTFSLTWPYTSEQMQSDLAEQKI